MRSFGPATLFAHSAVFLFALSSLIARWLDVPVFLIVFGRTVFASVALAVLIIAMREKLLLRTQRDTVALLGSSILLALHWTTFFLSVRTGSVAIATLTFATFPVMTALIEPTLFREKFHAWNLFAAFGALLGVVLISLPSGNAPPSLAGIGWGLASAGSFAALSLMNRGRVRNYPARVIAFYQNAGAAICVLPFIFTAPFDLTLLNVGVLFFLGVFCTALAHTLYIQSMKELSATTAGLIACLEPVYAILLAALFLGETLTWTVVASGALILGSSLIPGKLKGETG